MNLSTLSLNICHQGFFIALGFIGVGILITFHELGHYLFCKLFNIATPTFSIGFGPRIFAKKIGNTDFVLSLIPLGGYVEIAGNAEVGQGEQKSAHANDETSFTQKPYYQKLLVMCGGILFNVIFSYIAFTALFFTNSVPHELANLLNTVTPIVKISSTTTETLKSGDHIITINNVVIDKNPEKIISLIKNAPNKIISFEIIRDGTAMAISVQTTSKALTNNPEIMVGHIDGFDLQRQESTLPTLLKGVVLTHKLIQATAKAIIAMIKRDTTAETGQIAGPIRLFAACAKSAAHGLSAFVTLLAIISINLAIINLLPLPVLDGGQIAFISIEALIRRQLPIRLKEIIFLLSWVLVIAIMLHATFYDIKTICSSPIKTANSPLNK